MVFQDYSRSLFPWLRVGRNVDFPLARRGLGKRERAERVRQSLAAVGLEEVADRYPWQLSGGMQQRVAIARALAYRPRLLLMDEPFASVDAQPRADLEDRVLVLPPGPARLVAEIPVPLPHPRDQSATKELDAFVKLRAEVGRLIRAH